MPRVAPRHCFSKISSLLTGYFLRPEPVSIASRKSIAVRLREVTEACILEVMRSIRIVTTVMLPVAFAGLQSVVIALVVSPFRTTEDVLVTEAVVVIAERPIAPPGVIEWPRSNIDPGHNHHSTLSLRRSTR